MHAVIRTGGKQYYVTPGDILEVEKLVGEVGATVAFEDVLLLANAETVMVGQPTVEGASVTAQITGQHRGQKIQVFRYRPKKRIRVRKGHRQYLTRIQVQSIRLADGTEYAAPVVEEVAVAAPVEVATEEAVVMDDAADDAVDETADAEAAATAETTPEATSDVADSAGDANDMAAADEESNDGESNEKE
ncbi:MAG: 50S ribosomal protein L21 [Caldilineaceae bacterium]